MHSHITTTIIRYRLFPLAPKFFHVTLYSFPTPRLLTITGLFYFPIVLTFPGYDILDMTNGIIEYINFLSLASFT